MRSALMYGTVAGLVVLGHALHAQSQTSPPTPSFEVASIKPNKSLEGGGGMGPRPGGQITAHNASVRVLVLFAYDLRSYQLAGGPGWIATDRFDVEARAAADTPI